MIGSYQYSELHERSNGRGILLSLTAGDPDPTTAASAGIPTRDPTTGNFGPPFTPDTTGGNFTDLTWDDTPGAQPDQTHPDQHAIVTPDDDPYLFFEGSDGGMIRSDGTFDNASADCLRYHFNDVDTLVHCQRVLSRVPHQLYDTMNKGLSTLQFQSVSVNPKRPLHDVQGGTQDNGTFDWDSQLTTWTEIMYGDGGESGGFPQHARAKAQVLQQYFHDARSQHVSAFFFKFLVGAEFDARAALRFRARQAGALEVVRAILHVCPQLFVCFVLHVPTAK